MVASKKREKIKKIVPDSNNYFSENKKIKILIKNKDQNKKNFIGKNQTPKIVPFDFQKYEKKCIKSFFLILKKFLFKFFLGSSFNDRHYNFSSNHKSIFKAILL